MQFIFDLSFYLWVGAVEDRIYVPKRADRRQIQSTSDLIVASQAKVSSSLDGFSHQIRAAEPHGSIHVVCEHAGKSKMM